MLFLSFIRFCKSAQATQIMSRAVARGRAEKKVCRIDRPILNRQNPQNLFTILRIFRSPCRARTSDNAVNSRALYQLS